MRKILLAGIALLAISAPEVASQPIYPGGSAGPVYCNKSAPGTGAPGTYEVVPLDPGMSIYVCGQNVTATAAATWQMKYGNGALCAGQSVNVTPPFAVSPNAPFATRSPVAGHYLPRGMALCVTVGGTGPTQWVIFFSQF